MYKIKESSPWGCGNSREVKFTQLSAVLSHTPFTLKHLQTSHILLHCILIEIQHTQYNNQLIPYLNRDCGLLVLIGGEHLRFLCGDNCVPGNQFGHHPTNSFNSKGQRSNIQQQDICNTLKWLTPISLYLPTLDASWISYFMQKFTTWAYLWFHRHLLH